MHLVYIQNMRLPTEKAHGYQIMKTCEALVHSGASVSLHVPNRKTPILQDAFSYYDVKRIFEIKRHPVMDWIGLVPTPLKPLAFFFERISFIKSLKKSLPSNADVYFTRDPWLAVELTQLTKDIPVYLELHALPNKRTVRNLSMLSGMLCVTKWMQNETKMILPKLIK